MCCCYQNIALQARKTKKPVIGECDAGLLKLTVPIFVGDEFLGVGGGCGLLTDDSEVETYLISMTIGVDEELFAATCVPKHEVYNSLVDIMAAGNF